MTVTVGTWDIGYETEEGETRPTYFIIPITDNDEGLRLIGRKRSRLIPPGITGTINWPFSLAGILGADLTTEIRGIGYSVVGEPRTRVPDINIPSLVPAKMTNEESFIGAWAATNGGEVVIADETPPTVPDGATIIGYRLRIDEDDPWNPLVADADLPATLAIRPSEVSWWEWGAASFTVDMSIACVIEGPDGIEVVGPYSDAVTLTLTNSDLYYVPDADWTGTTTDAEGPEGIVDLALDGGSGFSAPTGYEARAWAGALPEGASASTLLPLDWATDETTEPIEPGDTLRFLTGVAGGGTAYSVILIKDLASGGYELGSTRKTHTIPSIVEDPDYTPVLLAAGTTITGTVGNPPRALIGTQVTGDVTGGADGWGNITSRENQFRVAGVLVGSAATDAPATYTPVAGDDGKNLSLRIRGINTTPDPDAVVTDFSGARLIVYPAPTLTGTGIADQTFTAGSGDKTIAAATVAAAFAGTIAAYELVSGEGSINAATGEISVPDPGVAATLSFSVRGTNSGGSSDPVNFTAFWEAEVGPTPFPPTLASNVATVSEVRDETEAGGIAFKRKITWTGQPVVVPEGFALHFYSFNQQSFTWAPAYVAVTPGTDYTTPGAGGMTLGTTIYPKLGWRRISDGTFQTAWSGPSFVLQGLSEDEDPPPPTGWVAVPAGALNNAKSRNVESFTTGDTTPRVGGWFGAPMAVLGYASFTGDTSCDAKVLQAVRNCLSGGNAPVAASGFSMQFEAGNWAAVVAFAKMTPRLWNQLSAAEVAKIDILMKALAKAAAWSSSDKTSVAQYTLSGVKNNYPRGNPNYYMANPFMLAIMIAYMGSAQAVDTFLRNTSASSISSGLTAQSMSNTLTAWKTSRPANAPSFATIDNSCTGWTLNGYSVFQMEQLFIERMATGSRAGFGKKCFTAHPQSASIGGRAALMGASTPALTAMNGMDGMPWEMDSSDGDGLRSSAVYALDAIKMAWNWALIMLVSGQVAKNDAALAPVRSRVGTGFLWYDRMITIGWKNYAKGGQGGGNGDTRRAEDGAARGLDFNLPMWLDVVGPMLAV